MVENDGATYDIMRPKSQVIFIGYRYGHYTMAKNHHFSNAHIFNQRKYNKNTHSSLQKHKKKEIWHNQIITYQTIELPTH